MVYVDPTRPCVPNARWRYSKSCHLFADSLPELQKFAVAIGLKLIWLQSARVYHFDLTTSYRIRAIRAGAREVTLEEASALFQKLNISPSVGISTQQNV